MYTKVKDKPYCGVNQRKIVESNPQLRANEIFEFVQMIKDRYRIHKRKDVQGKPKPWTNNPIMQQYKFTNVRREHDRETKWLIEHITSNPNVSYNNKILNCILFRMFNKHQTSELIQQPIDFKKLHQNPDKYKHSLSAAKSSGQILFTNAFYTTGMRQGVQKCLQGNDLPSDFSGNDILRYVDYLYQDGCVSKIKAATNQKEVYEVLTSYLGIGSFLAYQMYVDMTYIDEFPFSENEFTVAGPGCKKGLDILFQSRDGLSYEECLFWLRDMWDDLMTSFGIKWNADKLFSDLPIYDHYMNVMSLENCFCEFSKYMRAKTGQGRPKIKYQGV